MKNRNDTENKLSQRLLLRQRQRMIILGFGITFVAVLVSTAVFFFKTGESIAGENSQEYAPALPVEMHITEMRQDTVSQTANYKMARPLDGRLYQPVVH